MSRAQARRELTVESLRDAMGDREWLSGKAMALLDEHPSSYKDIDRVTGDQVDLVRPLHTLRQVLNDKGTGGRVAGWRQVQQRERRGVAAVRRDR